MTQNSIAISSGDLLLYWTGIVIALGVAAWFAMSLALYTSDRGKASAMWLYMPIATVLSVLFARAVHWYCHSEQYTCFTSAITDYSSGGFCLPGVLLALMVAAVLVRLLCFTDSIGRLLDAVAPGACIGIALFRLSAIFNTTCRSTILITDPAYQSLPIGSAVTSSGGNVEYRFATFFVQFLLMLALAVLMVGLFAARRRKSVKRGFRRGHIFALFLTFYCAMEVVLDSTRNDSSFFPWNGFVSIVQIFSAVSMLTVFILYSVNSVKANGLRYWHWICWVLFAAAIGGAGFYEYWVQRHGNLYLYCYSVMSVCCIAICVLVYVMYLTVCERPRRAAAPAPENLPKPEENAQ